MTQEQKPRRRWYQFSLRTMFVVMVLACVVLAWVGYSLNWIRERHAATVEMKLKIGFWDMAESLPSAPGGLWLFGEEGASIIVVRRGFGSAGVEEVQRLFPEAMVRRQFDDESDADWPSSRLPGS